MEHQIKAPAVGESITEVRILKWLKQNGEAVKSGDVLVEIETDKATVEVSAESSGALVILKNEGETVGIGDVIAKVDDAQTGKIISGGASNASVSKKDSPQTQNNTAGVAAHTGEASLKHSAPVSPSVARMATESKIDLSKIGPGEAKGGRLTKGDLMKFLSGAPGAPSVSDSSLAGRIAGVAESLGVGKKSTDKPGDRRVEMSRLRLKIAERLVSAQHTAAILTTFNEVDMTAVMALRNKHKENFKAKHGTGLSFMTFFTKASEITLKAIPEINASIEGKEIIYHDYADIGIAVGSERGLVVPVLRSVDKMRFVEIEKKIAEMAVKARDNKLTLADMEGGTFTISNGGTYGSLMSTPILNPPQSGILGMHKIQDRPVVVDGKVEVRPMMYIALSYDHRIVDGKGAVTFLVNLKDLLENPEKMNIDLELGK